ncbi:hypothetical protein [Aeromonas salmonicida]|uniref:hypothetical protein n=1 Tax=Aeromonas salmonicida TaxID=645 RepID=UPI002856C2E2|nr:hypothetical protein [Aeromonas salmonicida]MDR7020215.1 beta-lactamase superfamily II metal-dependent hydrolase [Aeromonas salmonicida]
MKSASSDASRYFCLLDKNDFTLEYNDSDDDNIKYGISLVGFDIDNLKDNQEKISLFSIEVCHKDLNAVKSKKNNFYVPYFRDRFFRNHMFAILTIEPDPSGDSYKYVAYGNEPISRLRIKSISFQQYKAPLFNNAKTALDIVNKMPLQINEDVIHNYENDFSLKAYTVGQGMCSLLCDGDVGYLLDAGAGTPITRKNYIDKKIKNELSNDIDKLNKLYLILSHLDSDHFRIIRWDSTILSKIDTIFIPLNLKWVESNEKSISGKVAAINKLSVTSKNFILNAFRTEHYTSSAEKNDNELVTHLVLNNNNILYPGDYSYTKITKDKNTEISTLAELKYHLLLVPHHGDKDSQYKIPKPQNDSSLAYFSAGDHKSWCHPNTESLDEHKSLGYKNCVDNTNPDITEIVKI